MDLTSSSQYLMDRFLDSADQDLPQVVFVERAGQTGYDEHPEACPWLWCRRG
jgi:hypothetical protein